MKAIIIIITPEQAKKWLEKNYGSGRGNRKVSLKHLQELTDSILNGQWVLNGETIKIGRDGSIIDGQHRLMAIVKANIAVESLVVFDCDPASYNTIDKGRARTAGEAFRNLDIRNSASVAAATCMVKMLLTNARSTRDLSTDERILIYREHAGLLDRFAGGARRLRNWGVNPSVELGVMVLLSTQNYSDEQIVGWFQNFADDKFDDNQRLLAKALRNEKAALGARAFNTWWVAGIIIKAFRNSMSGVSAKQLRFTSVENYV